MTQIAEPQTARALSSFTELCEDIALGRRMDVDQLFSFTLHDAGLVSRLAEAFGLLLVKLESRDCLNSELMNTLREQAEELARQREYSRAKRPAADGPDEHGLIAGGMRMRALMDEALRIAARPINTLLTGPTGVGKDVMARFIHRHSVRSEGPFIAVNCTAIPDTLFESTFFGIEKGVATGVGARKGLMEEADGGILFLDELGEMPLGHQAKLLRALENGEVMPVGAAKPVPVDIVLISATNARLEELVAAGKFRQDLYYRVKVAELALPSLQERQEDIAPIARHFLEKYSRRMGRMPLLELTPEAVACLRGYDWPGNVRELRNEMERAAALTQGDTVRVQDLSARIAAAEPAQAPEDSAPKALPAMDNSLDAVILTHISRVLEMTGGNRSQAARVLGISREGLRKRLLRDDAES